MPRRDLIFHEDASEPQGDAARPGAKSSGGETRQPESPPARFRLRFEKRGALKFISHHDLMRTFELALRRAGVDVAHTRGFNPRPKLSFAMALPLGVESLDEILDLDLATPLSPTTLLELLQSQMPSGLKLLEAWPAKGRPRVTACDFEAELELSEAERAALAQRLQEFLGGGAAMHTRRKGPGKRVRVLDARAHTLEAELGASRLKVRIAFGPQGGMKATDLLEVLGLDPLAHRIVKTKTIFEEDTRHVAQSVDGQELTVNGNEQNSGLGRQPSTVDRQPPKAPGAEGTQEHG